MENKKEPMKVNIKVGEITLPKRDMKQYIGKKEKIVSVDIYKGQDTFNKGVDNYYVKVTTTCVDKIQKGKEEIDLCATRIFSLRQDENGSFGWAKDSELGLFLASKRCKSLEELKGKEVIVQIKEKNGNDFLTFT